VRHPDARQPDHLHPDWYFVASTGNVSAQKIEDALMTYAPGDEVVIIPIFDATCCTDPGTDGKDDCTTGEGNGQNQFYHLAAGPALTSNGSTSRGPAVCGSGNGSTGCFKGQFIVLRWHSRRRVERGNRQREPLAIVSVRLIDSQ